MILWVQLNQNHKKTRDNFTQNSKLKIHFATFFLVLFIEKETNWTTFFFFPLFSQPHNLDERNSRNEDIFRRRSFKMYDFVFYYFSSSWLISFFLSFCLIFVLFSCFVFFYRKDNRNLALKWPIFNRDLHSL